MVEALLGGVEFGEHAVGSGASAGGGLTRGRIPPLLTPQACGSPTAEVFGSKAEAVAAARGGGVTTASPWGLRGCGRDPLHRYTAGRRGIVVLAAVLHVAGRPLQPGSERGLALAALGASAQVIGRCCR